ncbi:MAG TPA: OmpA family protein [Anaeromyxobacteraceae bacterium]|nr:OmpA family protein [Anaeromyxobacteraceae bacterium]
MRRAILSAAMVAAGCATTGAPAGPYVSPQFCMPCPIPCYPIPACYPKAAAAPAPAPVVAAPVLPTAAPAFSPAGGTFTGPQSVSISSATPGAVVRCTTDGSEPSAASPECPGPISVGTGTTTLKAMATSAGAPASPVSTATYVVEPPPPPAPPARVSVTKEKIELKEKIFFDTGKTSIKPESFGILDETAQVLKDHPDIGKVVVEGHTDSLGKAASNQKLSQGRALAVVKYLEGKGVAASRLEAKGLGETKPIADNATAKGREANRRVEMVIVH